eukprot:6687834-Prymnesium_polylepis.4
MCVTHTHSQIPQNKNGTRSCWVSSSAEINMWQHRPPRPPSRAAPRTGAPRFAAARAAARD